MYFSHVFTVLLASAVIAQPTCFGESSSDLSGKYCDSACGQSCVCDFNPVCNSCNQLFAGCSTNSTLVQNDDVQFSTRSGNVQFPYYIVKGQFYPVFNLTSRNSSENITDICVQPALPDGIVLNKRNDTWQLNVQSENLQVMPFTNYTIFMKGSYVHVGKSQIAFSIINRCQQTFTVSNNGSCGGNLLCTEGNCCSRWNFCGKGDLYCGQGCHGGNCTTEP